MYNSAVVRTRNRRNMADDSADNTIPAHLVASTAHRSADALESGRMPVYRGAAIQTGPPTPKSARRAPKRAAAITDSPPHSVVLELNQRNADLFQDSPPPVIVPRRAVTKRAPRKSKKQPVQETHHEPQPPTPVEQPVVIPARPTIRTLQSTTTAEDDGSSSTDSSDALPDGRRVRFSTPLSSQLDALEYGTTTTTTSTARPTEDVAKQPPPPPPKTSPVPTPAANTPRPSTTPMSNDQFVSMMRSSARRQLPQGVEVIPDRFEQFQSDSAAEFFDANKPPWAPRIAPRALALARKWKSMEIWDDFDLRSQSWYSFMEKVAGYTDTNDVSEFAQTLTYGERTGLVAPTRVGDRPGLIGVMGAAVTDSGGGIIDPSVAGMLSPDNRLPPPPVSRDGAPSGLFGGAALGSRIEQTFASGSGLPYGFPDNFGTTVSRGRLAPERRDLMEKLHTPDILDVETDGDRNVRRQERLDMVRALPYINRPLATGVFLLNPVYVSALNSAYAKVQIYAGSDTTLRNVPLSEFMRQRSREETGGDSASTSVRETFAELVACLYFLARDSRHRGERFKADRDANIQRINELLRLLRNRFGYNTQRRVFYDVTPANDERYMPAFERPSKRTRFANSFNTVFPTGSSMMPFIAPIGPSLYRDI
jgi:hypothetical protein